jgi:chemotaxis family two-component system response regulator Rcp1
LFFKHLILIITCGKPAVNGKEPMENCGAQKSRSILEGEASYKPGGHGAMKPRCYRIFVVEDSPADLRLIQEALREYAIEYELSHYSAADAAISAIANCGVDGKAIPDLILLDFNVPRGEGRDVLAAASNNPALAATPKAVLSSSMSIKDRDQAMKLGARCFVVKPSELDPFLTQVGSMIAGLLV